LYDKYQDVHFSEEYLYQYIDSDLSLNINIDDSFVNQIYYLNHFIAKKKRQIEELKILYDGYLAK
jgi:hypothetical protein